MSLENKKANQGPVDLFTHPGSWQLIILILEEYENVGVNDCTKKIGRYQSFFVLYRKRNVT